MARSRSNADGSSGAEISGAGAWWLVSGCSLMRASYAPPVTPDSLPVMAAEISESPEITDSNQDLHAEVHEILRIMLRLEAALIRFGPLLDQAATSPLTVRRAIRKAGR